MMSLMSVIMSRGNCKFSRCASVVCKGIAQNLKTNVWALTTCCNYILVSMGSLLFIFTLQLHQYGIYNFPFKIFKQTYCYCFKGPCQWFCILQPSLLQVVLPLILGWKHKCSVWRCSSGFPGVAEFNKFISQSQSHTFIPVPTVFWQNDV